MFYLATDCVSRQSYFSKVSHQCRSFLLSVFQLVNVVLFSSIYRLWGPVFAHLPRPWSRVNQQEPTRITALDMSLTKQFHLLEGSMISTCPIPTVYHVDLDVWLVGQIWFTSRMSAHQFIDFIKYVLTLATTKKHDPNHSTWCESKEAASASSTRRLIDIDVVKTRSSLSCRVG